MAQFKIVTTGPGKTDHSFEMETLANIGAEIIAVSGNEDDLSKAVADADAIHAKGRPRHPATGRQPAKTLKAGSPGPVARVPGGRGRVICAATGRLLWGRGLR